MAQYENDDFEEMDIDWQTSTRAQQCRQHFGQLHPVIQFCDRVLIYLQRL